MKDTDMNQSMKLGLAALVFAGGMTGIASADGPRGERGMGQVDFETLDRTGDGLLTGEDFAAAADARFAELDADGDGEVTEAEFLERAGENAAERAAEMFARLDADGDGVLSRDVFEARGADRGRGMGRMIARFDSDGDGAIDAGEFETARAEMREMRRERSGHGWSRHR